VNIKQRNLPIFGRNLGLHDLKSSALLQLSQYPESEINTEINFPESLTRRFCLGSSNNTPSMLWNTLASLLDAR
jgi:hypothetical protein